MEPAYKTSFSRAMGSTETFGPDQSVSPPPAQRGAHRKVAKGKPSMRPALTHKTLGALKITYAADRTYFTAAEASPKLMVECSQKRFGEKHKQVCERIMHQCAEEGLSKEQCKSLRDTFDIKTVS